MLVLTRTKGQKITAEVYVHGEKVLEFTIEVVNIVGDKVKLGLDAPLEVTFIRSELL